MSFRRHAQDKPPRLRPRPSSARAEFLDEIAYYEQRYTRLAEAVPADKYNWRPAEGVRSIGEVYAHIVAANYGIARAFGTQPPAGVDLKAITAAASDKAKTVQALKDSFAHFRQAIWRPERRRCRQSAKDVRPPNHPAWRFHPGYRAHGRASRSVYRLCPHERRSFRRGPRKRNSSKRLRKSPSRSFLPPCSRDGAIMNKVGAFAPGAMAWCNSPCLDRIQR